jgi:hypothetical protein
MVGWSLPVCVHHVVRERAEAREARAVSVALRGRGPAVRYSSQ